MASSRGCGRWVVVAYALLLLASHAVSWLRPAPQPQEVGGQALTVEAVEGAERLPQPVRLAYQQWGPAAGGAEAPVLLLLHGSPGSSHDFDRLGPELGQRYRVVAPDLPGFGASTHEVPDYSIRAHAEYALQLLDALGIEEVHTLGFSMGGGVALQLVARAPERVESVILLSAIGVQELELLGDYHLNHGLHGLQLGFLWFLHEGFPHFGALDGSMLSMEYGRNFFDSDQRPLRRVLQRLQVPTLIIHGSRDVLVPVAAAREHHRLAPQSELVMYEASHFMVFSGGERLVRPISDFVDRVERGEATTRATASEARRAAAARPFDPSEVAAAVGVTLVVLMLLIAVATLVTEDLTCIAAGLLVAHGRLSYFAAAAACFAGIFIGDMLLYAAGRYLGRPWLRRAPLRWLVSPRDVEHSSHWFAHRGPVVILMSRFLPGTRLPTYVAAGVLRTPILRFTLYFGAAAALWTPVLVALAALVGARAFIYFELFSRYAVAGVVVVAVGVWLSLKLVVPLFTWQGRRQLRGRWCRLRRWEFWPPWAFYPPVILHWLWLSLRYRSLTLFTAANPAIADGGFIGESKVAILSQLAPAAVARFRYVEAEASMAEKVAAVRSFLAGEGLQLPVVVKPDEGQRGSGVEVARTWPEVEAAVARMVHPFVVQEYVAGPELGVFYLRRPGEERGRIVSITEKHLPVVVGDGERTIEELILGDPRAVCVSHLYLEGLADRRDEVPEPGEMVALTDLGTHCRGAVFRDGGRHLTPELEAAIDRISRSFDGFYFGRYDLRAPSVEAFRRGEEIKVLELNGVTSEATHIYDPGTSLLQAYRMLFRQWRWAYEIGRRNRERGAPITPATTLVRALLTYRLQARRRSRRGGEARAGV